MPTEEEPQQTGPSTATPDSTKQQTETTIASKDDSPVAPEKLPTGDAIEEPSDHHKTEAERRRPEVSDDGERSETSATEPSGGDSAKKATEEGSKTEPEVTPEDGGSIGAAGSDSNSRLIAKPDSSPQPDTAPTQQEDGGDKETPPVTSAPVDEEDDDDEEDDEEPGDNDDPDEQPQRQKKQRSAGSRDGYSNEDESSNNAQQQPQQEQQQQQQQQQQRQQQTPTGGPYYEDDEEDDEDEGEEPSELGQLFATINDSQALSEDEEDGDYIPDEEVKKTIMVGSDFQAVIPEGLCRYDDALPYENEDKLLWNPTILNEQEIEDYLVKSTAGPGSGVAAAATAAGNLSANATAPGTPQQKGAGAGRETGPGTNPTTTDPQSAGVYAIPLGNHLRDDEQSLYLLQQCGHNVDEALRRKRISNNAVPVPEQQMSIWSEEECRNFENGLRVHGKDFHMIQQTKVRTRSVGELVQFYYLWKKTERHDLFASKARLEKKKYNLHPGLTDHMDRFLEEQENSTGFGDRSSSPGFNSLYSSASEAKRQRLLDSKENNTATAKRSASNL